MLWWKMKKWKWKKTVCDSRWFGSEFRAADQQSGISNPTPPSRLYCICTWRLPVFFSVTPAASPHSNAAMTASKQTPAMLSMSVVLLLRPMLDDAGSHPLLQSTATHCLLTWEDSESACSCSYVCVSAHICSPVCVFRRDQLEKQKETKIK